MKKRLLACLFSLVMALILCPAPSIAASEPVDFTPPDDTVPESAGPAPSVQFIDVSPGDYYYDAVVWAVENGITNGTDADTFSPDKTCTHAQILTFLWRAAGSPSPTGHIVVNGLNPDVYYYQTLKWAAENDMLASYIMNPEISCTRAAAVSYMWKYDGKSSSDTALPFSDVGEDVAMAVRWALDCNVTNGTSDTTFSPNNTCTRGQIVTFLYRAFAAQQQT